MEGSGDQRRKLKRSGRREMRRRYKEKRKGSGRKVMMRKRITMREGERIAHEGGGRERPRR